MDIQALLNHDLHCICGRTHRCDIAVLDIRKGALEALDATLRHYHHILLVADSNTYPLCGDHIRHLLKDRISDICLFPPTGEEPLVPDEASIERIEACLTADTDLILGIGSGVINDLCKYVSFFHHMDSGIIATATSMDGYASSGAAMILGGMKVTVTTHAPTVIIGDVDLLSAAPMDMIRSGYADIIGKYSALCDWKLSAAVNGEYLCPYVYDIVKAKTDEVRSLARALTERDPDAIRTLMETLVLIGACLTLLSTTRPGSGSEHHLSHFFEITGLIEHTPYFLHGTDVGYATVETAAMRERIRTIESPSFVPLSRSTRLKCYKKIYHDFDQEVLKIQDDAGRYEQDLTPIYLEKWQEIRSILLECPTADEIRQMLLEVGFDLEAFTSMYGAEKIRNSTYFGKDLKDRYSVLWLYCSLFLDETEAKTIYEA